MTKADQKRKAQSILKSYKPGEFISNDDYYFMMSVFENHPDWERKMGSGVDEISVQSALYGSKCFYLHRLDGTKTDISYNACLNAPTRLADIKKACRNAVVRDILKFRDENVIYGETKCPITGDTLTKENTHIDHYDKTFAELCNTWIESQNLQYLTSKLNQTQDNNMLTYFTDENLSRSFRIYHNMNTHLRAVTKYANCIILCQPSQ